MYCPPFPAYIFPAPLPCCRFSETLIHSYPVAPQSSKDPQLNIRLVFMSSPAVSDIVLLPSRFGVVCILIQMHIEILNLTSDADKGFESGIALADEYLL
jgi:hypothetical protein